MAERVLAGSAKLVTALLAGMVIGFAAGRWKYREPFYSERRAQFVEHQGRMFGHADTLVIGDSLSEQTDLSEICGRTFAAAIGGARIQDSARVTAALLPIISPRTIIIAVGANLFTVDDEYDTFVTEYSALLNQVRGYRLILVGVVNSTRASAFIAQRAKALGATYVPPILAPLQADGLHHTVAGSIKFRKSLVDACSRVAASPTR